MKTNHQIKSLLLAAAIALPSILIAQPSAHYPPGLEGVKAATLPPPGLYVRDYNYFYFADRLNDSNGNEIKPADPEAFIYANAPRVLWITDMKALGGFVGFDALVPLQQTSLEANTPAGRFDESDFNVGDLFAEATLSWHLAQLDAAVGFGVWAPTGNSSPLYDLSTDAGKGYWTPMFTAGATYYFDTNKQWAVSILNRYELNTQEKYTDITPGDAWTVEGGFSYGVSKTVDVGLVGYHQRQLNSDKGGLASSARDWVAGAGPEVSVFYPRIMFGWSFRYLYEFAAENRLQGHTAVLTLTKRF
jgi:hypothetical protein